MPALSDKFIRALQPPASGRRIITDQHKTAPGGFALKITNAGKRSFVLRYNVDGKDRLMSIGDYGTWTLAAARREAQKLRQQIDGGTDLLEQRRDRRAESTVADVAERWERQHASKLKSSASIHSALQLHILPIIGDTRISQVKRRDVIAMVEKLAGSMPRQAALVLTYTKQIFEWAEDREIIEVNPVASLRASKVSRNLRNRKRERVLTDDEIRALWHHKPDGMAGNTWLILKFVLTTGQRGGEVTRATLSEIHGKTWTIPQAHRGKTEDAHDVPLTDTALQLIKDGALARNPSGVNALSKAVRRCVETLQPEAADPWRPHDLRRTMRTGLAAIGISETVAELTIGHVRKGIESVYDQHRYEREKRAALESWERRLLYIVNGGSDGKVVPIIGART